jgi:predicted transposase YbfD/YdcC
MAPPSFTEHFADLDDPRVERTRSHDLLEIIVMAVVAVISNADGWDDIVDFAKTQKELLLRFLTLRHGIPSADTFRRVFSALDPEAFNRCFVAWTQSLVESTEGKLVAIDGKTLRRSGDTARAASPRHLVSAWVGQNHIVFGQVATAAKSNEITAIPELLKLLDLRGATVTIDAMGCQRKIVDGIVAAGADYIIAVKDNQPTLHNEVQAAFVTAEVSQEALPAEWTYRTQEKAHGRAETRTTTVLDVQERLSEEQIWNGMRSLVRVTSVRTTATGTSEDTRFFISSRPPSAAALAQCIRGHWGIENSQHWTLDMAFDEDRCRIRRGHAPDNFALLRKIALNLLKAETTAKRGVTARRKLAGWSEEYLMRVLGAVAASSPPLHVG